jgi:hypothetical protein
MSVSKEATKFDFPFIILNYFKFIIGGFKFEVQRPERQGRGLE